MNNRQRMEFVGKKALQQLDEEGYHRFLNQAYGVFSAGKVSTIQVNILRQNYAKLLRSNRRKR